MRVGCGRGSEGRMVGGVGSKYATSEGGLCG